MRFLMKCFVLPCLICMCILQGNGFASASQALLVWGEAVDTTHNVYFSQQIDGVWSDPIVLASDDNPILHPTVVSNSNDEIWAVWSILKNGKGKLQYRFYRNGEWSETAGIETLTDTDLAPSLQVDSQGVVCLVWAGLSGDDDIYFSQWAEGDWVAPKLINKDDSWPDILPRLERIENGQLQVVWSGYNGNRYINYVSTWNGQRWSPENELATAPNAKKISSLKSILPEFLNDTSQAALYLQESNGGRDVYYGE